MHKYDGLIYSLAGVAFVIAMTVAYSHASKKTVEDAVIWLPKKHEVKLLTRGEMRGRSADAPPIAVSLADFKRATEKCDSVVLVVIDREEVTYTIPDDCARVKIETTYIVQVGPRANTYGIDDARSISYADPGRIFYPVKLHFKNWFFVAVLACLIPPVLTIGLGFYIVKPENDGERTNDMSIIQRPGDA